WRTIRRTCWSTPAVSFDDRKVAVAATPSMTLRVRERAGRAERTDGVLAQLSEAEAGEHDDLIHELVAVTLAVAEAIAARYRRRGIPDEDLEQVAYLALVRVARSYDPERGHDFMSYAVPSIRGEVRRYFRDQGWMVRPPRRIQEMQGRLAATESELSTDLGHPPSAEELAEQMDEPVADVEEGMSANGSLTAAAPRQP